MTSVADRVQETTSTTGTGTVTLNGAVTGFRTFTSAFSNGTIIYYVIAGPSEWEVGSGTLVTATTVSRTTVLASSNGGSLVNFSAGSKLIWSGVPASAIIDGLGASITKSGIAATSTDGLALLNATAATSGVPVQYAPRYRVRGSAWNTTGGGSSETHDWWWEVQPSSGGSTSSSFVLAYSKAGGATQQALFLSEGFTLTCSGGFVGTGVVRSQATTLTGATAADGLVTQNITATTSGTVIQWSPRTRWSGTAWTGSASQQCNWSCEARPINGATPTVDLVFSSEVNAGGTYSPRVAFTSTGDLELRGNTKGTCSKKAVNNVGSTGAGAQALLTMAMASNSAVVMRGKLVGIKSDHTAVYPYTVDVWSMNNGGTVTVGGTIAAIAGGTTTTTAPAISVSSTNAVISSGDTAATSITWTLQVDVLSVIP